MEVVKKINIEDDAVDIRTDLEELEDLKIKIRNYRRKINDLAEGALKNAFSNSKKPTDEKEIEIADLWKAYNYLQKSYDSLMKICYPKGSKGEDSGFGKMKTLEAVKKEKSSVKDIITTIPQSEKI